MTYNIYEYLKKPTSVKVGELCQEKFNLKIPSYQRGYRWTEKEVLRLIEDVFHYDAKKDGSFYCLQPLVVRHIESNGNHVWKVIDGQQRLTTIYLILKTIGYKGECYSLEYEREKLLDKIYNKELDSEASCEIWHLTMARKAIEKWLNKNADKENGNNKVLLTNILEHCCFILYVMKEDDHWTEKEIDQMEHNLFNNLNSGKISLTESELIKALFLHNIGEVKTVKEVKQISMSEELDLMERTLREDEMWYFLAGDQKKPSSCVDYLYKVWYLSQYAEIPQDVDYPIFSFLEESITSDKEMLCKWEEIKKCFHIITGWYNDPLLYNLIGYLEGRKFPKSSPQDYPPFHEYLLAKFYKFSTCKTKNQKLPTREEFIEYVKGQCLFSIPKNYIDARFDKDKNEVFNILLLLNVAMLVNNKSALLIQDSNKTTGRGTETKVGRFPFHVFHTVKWNVEHISPQNPKDKFELLKRLRSLKNEYKEQNQSDDIEKQNLPDDIEKLYKMLENSENNLSALDNDADYISLSSKFVLEKEDVMLLRNLTLLTEHDNKAIGNRFYFDKRNRLNAYQSQGSFIPAATINVFSKWYSQTPNGFIFWDENDQQAYQEAIENTINEFKTFCRDHE